MDHPITIAVVICIVIITIFGVLGFLINLKQTNTLECYRITNTRTASEMYMLCDK